MQFSLMRKRAQKTLLEAGFLGGALIFHPFRKVNTDDDFEQLDPDFSWKDAPACWYISPHFHALGYGWIHGERVREIYAETEWIVRNHGVRIPLPGHTMEDAVRATALYQLSHCGVNKRFHTVIWFGALAYNKMHCSPCPPEEHKCPECGARFRRILWLDPELQSIVESNLEEEAVLMVPVGLFRYQKPIRDPGG
jgi:hypothetical protein